MARPASLDDVTPERISRNSSCERVARSRKLIIPRGSHEDHTPDPNRADYRTWTVTVRRHTNAPPEVPDTPSAQTLSERGTVTRALSRESQGP